MACAVANVALAAGDALYFRIQAQPANVALNEYGRVTGRNLLFQYDLLGGFRTNEVVGTYDADKALTILLHGTGLVAKTSDKGNIIIELDAAVGEKEMKKSAGLWASLIAALTVPGAALPDATDSSKGGLQESPAGKQSIDEITVTAQKREERLIDVPQSVSVLSADTLARQGITQFRDYADRIPGLSYTTLGAGYTRVSLRGVTIGQDVTGTVGIYLDDVPSGSSTAFAGGGFTQLDVGLFDLERIEVLKGPQGTLYGASTIGGLLKYVTRRPDSTRFAGDVQMGVASVNRGGTNYNVSAAVNLPVVADKFAMRLSGFHSHDGGYIDNVALGKEDVNRADFNGGRVDLLFSPTEDLDIRLAGFAQNIIRDGMSQVDYAYDGRTTVGGLEQQRLIGEPFYNHFRLASATVNYDFGPATLTSITGYQTTDPMIGADVSLQYIPLVSLFGRSLSAVGLRNIYATDKFTQEVRIASNGTRRLEWMLGGFFTDEDSDVTGFLPGIDLTGQRLSDTELLVATSLSTYKESSAFGNVTWRLSDKFDVSAGLRYARHEQTYRSASSGLLAATSRPGVRSDDDVVTYMANVRYHLSERSMAYVRYATGYRPGGPNLIQIHPVTRLPVEPPPTESDEIASYELGYKRESEDRRLTLELAGYYIDWSNIQLFGRRDGLTFRTNAPGGATITGVELALGARPIPALSLTGAFNYNDAQLANTDPDIQGVEGERLPNSPDFAMSVSADYTFSEGGLRPTIGATFRHITERTSGYDAGTGSVRQYYLPEYSMVDLRAGLTVSTVDLQLYVRNLFDERAQLSAYTTYGPPLVTVAQPRTVGISATMSF